LRKQFDNPFGLSLSKADLSSGSWFDKPVLSEVEGLTTNGSKQCGY
jgi:hypothetical protein